MTQIVIEAVAYTVSESGQRVYPQVITGITASISILNYIQAYGGTVNALPNMDGGVAGPV